MLTWLSITFAVASPTSGEIYSDCLTARAKMYLVSEESAGDIATAVVQSCIGSEPKPTSTTVMGEMLPDDRSEVLRTLRASAEQKVTSWVVLYRTCEARPNCPADEMPGLSPMKAMTYLGSDAEP